MYKNNLDTVLINTFLPNRTLLSIAYRKVVLDGDSRYSLSCFKNTHSQAEGAYQPCQAVVVGLRGHSALLRPGAEDRGETLSPPKMCSPRRLRGDIAKGKRKTSWGKKHLDVSFRISAL